MLLVAPSGRVVAEDPTTILSQIESGEQWNDDQTLHGKSEVAAQKRRESICLAVERQRGALDLLVVLEFHLEQTHQLHCNAGGSGDPDDGVLVRGEDLLDVALRDEAPDRCPAIAGDDRAVRAAQGDDRRAVRGEIGQFTCRSGLGHEGAWEHREELGERGRARTEEGRVQAPGCHRRFASSDEEATMDPGYSSQTAVVGVSPPHRRRRHRVPGSPLRTPWVPVGGVG